MWNALTERWLLCLLAVEGVGSTRPVETSAPADASRDPAPPGVDEDPVASFRSADTVGKRSVSSGRVPSNQSIADHTLDFFNATSDKMSSGGGSIGGAISGKSTAMAEGVGNVSGKASDGVKVGSETVGTVVGGGARIAAKGVAGIFGFLGSMIGAVAKVIWSVIKGVFSVIGSIFSGLWTGLKEGVTGKNSNPPKEDKAAPEASKAAPGINDKQRQIVKRVAGDIDITAAQLIEAASRRDGKAASDASRRAAVQNQDLHRLIQAMEDKGYQDSEEFKRLRLLEATLQKSIELPKLLNGLGDAAPAEQDRARQRIKDIDQLLEGAERDGMAETPEFGRLLSMQTLIKEALAPAPKPAEPVAARPAPPAETPVAPTPAPARTAPPAPAADTGAAEPPARVTAAGVTDVPAPPEPVMPARPTYRAADGVDAPASAGRFAGLKLPGSMPWEQLSEADVRDFISDVLASSEAAEFRAAFPAAVKKYEALAPAAPARPAPAPADAPEPAAAPASGTVKHQLAKGETLKTLAKRYYQDEDKWTAIYDANKEKLGAWQKRHQDLLDRYNAKFNITQFPNPFLYPTGMILEVPADQ